MSYYVVVRGPLGVGKTTVSRALAKSLQGEVVSIDQIADKQWDGGSVRLYVRANGVAARRARRGLARGKPVVIDGCFYWKTQIKDLERRLPFDHVVITLQAPLSICVARDSQRKVPFGPEAARAVYRKVTRFEYGIPVDATQPVGSVVRKISSLLLTSR
ncbi:MAG TPA: AAA family ATPase [Thermoplasmata archaeon]|nr:AAA family ATPase [Thermoplasmata archaeon]